MGMLRSYRSPSKTGAQCQRMQGQDLSAVTFLGASMAKPLTKVTEIERAIIDDDGHLIVQLSEPDLAARYGHQNPFTLVELAPDIPGWAKAEMGRYQNSPPGKWRIEVTFTPDEEP